MDKKKISIIGFGWGKLPEDDPVRRRLDISKAKMVLGWEPKIGLEEGLLRMIRWVVEE